MDGGMDERRERRESMGVRIPTWNLYAVTQHLLTRRNFIFLNSPRGFRRSLEERSHNFILNSHHISLAGHIRDMGLVGFIGLGISSQKLTVYQTHDSKHTIW